MYFDPTWIFDEKPPKTDYPNVTGLMGEKPKVNQPSVWAPKQGYAIDSLADVFTPPAETPKQAAPQQPQPQKEPTTIMDRALFYANPMNFIKNQLANNLTPAGYEFGGGGGDKMRALKAIFREEPERKAFENANTPQAQSRMDFFNLYTGKPQKNNTLIPSTYKPSQSKDGDASYYKIAQDNEFVKYLLSTISDGEFIIPNQKITSDKYRQPVNDSSTRWIDHLGETNMGTYTKSLGEDEFGKYVSYYDKWDIEPRDFGTPFELYDRIYYKLDENGKAVRVFPGVSPKD